jgi:hypothetical protein
MLRGELKHRTCRFAQNQLRMICRRNDDGNGRHPPRHIHGPTTTMTPIAPRSNQAAGVAAPEKHEPRGYAGSNCSSQDTEQVRRRSISVSAGPLSGQRFCQFCLTVSCIARAMVTVCSRENPKLATSRRALRRVARRPFCPASPAAATRFPALVNDRQSGRQLRNHYDRN